VLYERRPDEEDDATDAAFLEELVLNLDVRPRSYRQVARDSVAIAQQLSVTVATAAVFFFASEGELEPAALLSLDGAVHERVAFCMSAHALRAVALMLAGFALRCALGGPRRGALQSLREAGVLCVGVYALSPLLQTLTGSISGDTIAACVAASLLAHLYLHDYAPANDVTQTIGGSLSLAAATFASVLLASRLPSPRHVFAQMLFSLQAFVAWPFLRRDLARRSWAAHAAAAAATHAAALAALARINTLLVALHAGALLFITFVCPYALASSYKLKRRINGCAVASFGANVRAAADVHAPARRPWDEARLQLKHLTD
jgi:phosphatidylinositol glycan class C protein